MWLESRADSLQLLGSRHPTERRGENPPIVMLEQPFAVAHQAPRPYLMAKAPAVGGGTLTGITPEASVWTKISHYVLGA